MDSCQNARIPLQWYILEGNLYAGSWCSLVKHASLSRWRSRVQIPSTPPNHAEIAQVVERWTENPCVPSSTLGLGTIFCGSSSVVERHLAKVRVAGSSPVFRSICWRHGQAAKAEDCKSFIPGSSPGAASNITRVWAASSEEERFLDAEEATGSSPVSPTRVFAGS